MGPGLGLRYGLYSAVTCQYLKPNNSAKNSTCMLASNLADRPVPTNERACHECGRLPVPSPDSPNRLVVSLAYCEIRKQSQEEADEFFQRFLPQLDRKALLRQMTQEKAAGPGTELKRLLARCGITVTPTCKCNQRAKIMNLNGPDWCEANIAIIVGWMQEEARKRKLPCPAMVARLIIRRAISKSRRGQSEEKKAES